MLVMMSCEESPDVDPDDESKLLRCPIRDRLDANIAMPPHASASQKLLRYTEEILPDYSLSNINEGRMPPDSNTT